MIKQWYHTFVLEYDYKYTHSKKQSKAKTFVLLVINAMYSVRLCTSYDIHEYLQTLVSLELCTWYLVL